MLPSACHDDVGTPIYPISRLNSWPVRTPVQRFAAPSRVANAWLGATVGRYSFGVGLFHPHLHAGLSRRFHKIEHRLFSQITMNWRGRPLTSHETILQLIGATTTATGLTVTATLDTGSYPIGIKISNREMAALPITRDEFHGDWNYTLHPTPDTPEPA
jgi:hypothetical protein